MTVIGLVAEGTNDFPALAAFLEHELPAGIPRPLKFIPLQPTVDATTGKMKGGGWGRVLGWCHSYSGEAIRTYFAPLFAGDTACDIIVVQIDGDAAQQCGDHSAILVPADDGDISGRVAALGSIVDQWLVVPSDLQLKLAYAFPYMHTEAWIMAALKPHEQHWESAAAKVELLKLKKATGIKANSAFYEQMSKQAAQQTGLIAEQCVSFVAFQQSLQKVTL